jgi:hypothetical protein
MTGRHSPDRTETGPRLLSLLSVLLVAGVLLVIISLLRNTDGSAVTTLALAGDTTAGTPTSASTTAPPPTTTTAAPSTTAAATTLADPLAALLMTETGIGDVRFGTGADDAVSQLSAVLGDPTEDRGWTATFETCPGPEARLVRWTSLQAFFTNGATDWAPQGTRHFFHYGNSISAGGGEVLGLRTDAGIAVGDSIGELKLAYGDRVTVSDDPLFGPLWEVRVDGAGALWGTAGTATDQGMIDSINGGPGCGE